MLLERPRGVLRTGREGTIEVITENCKETISHHFEVVLDGGRNPEIPIATSKVQDENKLTEPAHERFGVLAEPVGKEGVTSGPRSGESELTGRAETQCFNSIPSEGNVEVATEVESNAGWRTRSVETRRKFVNAFANSLYMDTELDD